MWKFLRLAPAFGRLRIRGHRALVRFTAEGALGGVAVRCLICTHSRLPSRNVEALEDTRTLGVRAQGDQQQVELAESGADRSEAGDERGESVHALAPY